MTDVIDFAKARERANTDILMKLMQSWADGSVQRPDMALTVVYTAGDGVAIYGANDRSFLEIIGLLSAAVNVLHQVSVE